MKFNISINQIKAIEWGLTPSEAMLFGIFTELSSWGKCFKVDGEDYYLLKTAILPRELPLISSTEDTFAKIIKKLINKELLERKYAKSGKHSSIYRLTEKGKSWVSSSVTCEKQNAKAADLNPNALGFESEREAKAADLNPNPLGFESERYIDIITLDHNTNINHNTKINNSYSPTNAESLFFSFWEHYPRKIVKAKAKKIFMKIDIQTATLIVEATKVFAEENKDTEQKYIPMPTTYLTQERYLDYEEVLKNKTEKREEDENLHRLTKKIKIFVDWYLEQDEKQQQTANNKNFNFGKNKDGSTKFTDEEIQILEVVGTDLAGYASLAYEDMILKQIRGAVC